MTSFSDLIFSLRSISLKWKLLIPFLLFSFVGTTTLVYIGLSSQEELIKREERKEVQKLYHVFLTVLDHKKEQALSLASVVSEIPEVEKLLAERDREGLRKFSAPIYEELKRDFGVLQFHFHIPPGQSFLRLHLPGEYGELMTYRKAPMEVMKTGKGVAGIERGLAGLGIRGVSPVFYQGALAGTIEVGFPLDGQLLDGLKRDWGAEFAVYENNDRDYRLLASTCPVERTFSPLQYLKGDRFDPAPVILISPGFSENSSVVLGPIDDYQGKEVALAQIEVSRAAVKRLLSHKRNIMVLVGALGLFLSFGLTWLVASLFIRPIKEIVGEAQEIAQGRRDSRLHARPNDEIGVLTHSLNMMLRALKERQKQIQDHARTLELKVWQRTADLVASEEKYRSLVENLPLVVYRILPDGTTEFVNPYFTEKLGYPAEEVGRDKDFWLEKVCGYTGQEEDPLSVCWREGKECRVERVVKDREGRPLTFIDHAIPYRDEQGRVQWIDGTMVDITELKRLQEKAIRTEEIRILGEVSARLAHEIRNPLATAGGFARRLRDSLPPGDPNLRIANIIVEEVARLEAILRVILSSITPISLSIGEVDFNKLLRSLIRGLDDDMKAKKIRIEVFLSSAVPVIQADERLLGKAFENLLKNAIVGMPEGEDLSVTTSREDDHVVVSLGYRLESFSDEDFEQFFYPRFESKAGPELPELPLSKIIIHRHGGKVDVLRKGGGKVLLRIELPAKAQETRPAAGLPALQMGRA